MVILTSWVHSITATTKGTIWIHAVFFRLWYLTLLRSLHCWRGSKKMTKTSLLPGSLHLLHVSWRMVTGPSQSRRVPPPPHERCQNTVLFKRNRHSHCCLIHSKLYSLGGSSISSTGINTHQSQIKKSMRMYSFTNYFSLALLGIRKILLYNYFYATDLFTWH